jgi:hypothetical protein
VTREEIYLVLELIMLMRITQKPTIKIYFTGNPFLDTSIFSETISQDRYEFIVKFMHFMNNIVQNHYY